VSLPGLTRQSMILFANCGPFVDYRKWRCIMDATELGLARVQQY